MATDSLEQFSAHWLPVGEVHLWQAGLDLVQTEIEACYRSLSEEEIWRADRYHFERDRRRFVARRGILRQLLSRYIDKLPSDLQLVVNRYGKPSLAQPDLKVTELHFNLSYSNELALFAFARGRAIGVDVEQLRADFDPIPLAERFFSTRECETLRLVAEKDRRMAFFMGWTRKEAFVKALGIGFSIPLDQFDVSLMPGEPARLLARRDEPQPGLKWTLLNIDLGPSYLAALAVEGDRPITLKRLTVEQDRAEGSGQKTSTGYKIFTQKTVDVAESG